MSARVPLIVFATCFGAFPVWSQTAGVILGAAAKGNGYRTLWIYPSGKAMIITSIRGLLVPHGSGFWQVGKDQTAIKGDETKSDEDRLSWWPKSDYESSEERLWIEPAAARHIAKLKPGEAIVPDDTETCRDTERSISFVSREYLAYDDNTIVNCGVHPDGDTQWNVVRLDALAGPRISILEFLGEAARKSFVDGLNGAALKQGDGVPGACEGPEEVDFGNWAVVRGKGRWVLRGYVALHRLCGYFAHFDLAAPVPEKAGKEPELPIKWQALANEIPDLQDALASPQGDLLVALTTNEVLVYQLHGDRLGGQILRRTRKELNIDFPGELDPDSGKIIMAQWAEGSEVIRWTRGLQAFRVAEGRGTNTPNQNARRK